MAKQPRKRAKEIFLSALEETPERRQAFLEEACGEDAQLLERVQRLLRADAQAADDLLFAQGLEGAPELQLPDLADDGNKTVQAAIEALEGESPNAPASDGPGSAPGSVHIKGFQATEHLAPGPKSNYRILGEIARGGMGVILRGRDNDLGREVAVKVLHEDLHKRPAVVERFVEEAQIGGQLQHPGIVPVYEIGLMADRRPYFTMKFVRGRTLKELLAERTKLTEDRARFLSIFESVCQTMAYAHTRRVIHRDIKPGNIMVGRFGEVQVVDWGLAKVIGSPGESRHQDLSLQSRIETVRSREGTTSAQSVAGAVMGTPAYMSPEQARGEVESLDERTDVFSLGAVLFEVLTGETPYGDGREGTLVRAARAELDPAYRKLETCGADAELVRLAQRCLRKDPADRPRSAKQVAEAIHLYLAAVDERLQKAEVAAAYEHARASGARKILAVTLAAAGLVAVALVASVFQWRRAGAAAVEAQLAQRSESAAKSALELKNQELARTNERLLSSNDDLEEAVQLADEEARKALAVSRFLTDVLTSSNPLQGGRFDLTVRDAVDGAVVRLDQGALEGQADVESRVRKAVGEAYAAVGAYGIGREQIELSRKLALEEGGETYESLELLAQIGGALRVEGALDRSEEVLFEVLDKLGALPEDTRRLEALVVSGLAAVERDRARFEEALAHSERAVQLAREFENPALLSDLLNDQSLALEQLGRLEEAIVLLEEAYALNLEERGPEHYGTALSQSNLAGYYAAVGQLDRAEQMYGEALAVLRRTSGGHPNVARCLDALGRLYREQGRLQDAWAAMQESLAIRLEVAEPGDVMVGYGLNNLALIETDFGLLDDAAAHLAQALPIFLEARGEGHPTVEKMRSNLAAVRRLQGNARDSIDHLRQLLSRSEQDDDADELSQASLRQNLATVLAENGELDEAEELLQKTLAVRSRLLGEDTRESATTLHELANVLRLRGELDEAEQLAERVLDLRLELLGPENMEVALTRNLLGLIERDRGELEAALEHVSEAVRLAGGDLGADHWRVAILRSNQATLQASLGRFEEAEPEQLEAQRVLSDVLGERHPHTRRAMRRLVELYEAWDSRPGDPRRRPRSDD